MRGEALLHLLSSGQFYSGQKLADELQVSRTAVWNGIQYLKELGLDIFAVQGKGYRLAHPLELLDEQVITNLLPHTVSQRLDLDILSEIDSTNRHLLKRMFETQAGKVKACLAEYQQAGRGRRGRQWVSPFGANIYLSLLWRFERGIEAIEGLSLVVALSLLDTLEQMGISGVGVKWPNDIYYQGRKLAGILLEMSGESSGPCHIVIGVGLNVNMSQNQQIDIDQPWIDLYEIYDAPVSRNQVAAMLLKSLLETLDKFEQEGFMSFKSRWQDHDILYNRALTISEVNGKRQGIGRGIDDTGALLVEMNNSIQRIVAGDVSIRVTEEDR